MSEHLLTYAHAVYRTTGVLPLHIAVELMEAGYIVDKLTAAWDRLPMEAT